jgi:hypothetical protein
LYGIQGIVAERFTYYLTDKNQKVKIKAPNNTWNIFFKLENNKTWSSPRINITFLNIHINELPPTINTLPEPKVFADDSNIITSSKQFNDFCQT